MTGPSSLALLARLAAAQATCCVNEEETICIGASRRVEDGDTNSCSDEAAVLPLRHSTAAMVVEEVGRKRSRGVAGRAGAGPGRRDEFAAFEKKYRDVLRFADADEAEAVYSMVTLTQAAALHPGALAPSGALPAGRLAPPRRPAKRHAVAAAPLAVPHPACSEGGSSDSSAKFSPGDAAPSGWLPLPACGGLPPPPWLMPPHLLGHMLPPGATAMAAPGAPGVPLPPMLPPWALPPGLPPPPFLWGGSAQPHPLGLAPWAAGPAAPVLPRPPVGSCAGWPAGDQPAPGIPIAGPLPAVPVGPLPPSLLAVFGTPLQQPAAPGMPLARGAVPAGAGCHRGAAPPPPAPAAGGSAVPAAALQALDVPALRPWVLRHFCEDVYLLLCDAARPDSPRAADLLWAWRTHVSGPRAAGATPDFRALLVSLFGLQRIVGLTSAARARRSRTGEGEGPSRGVTDAAAALAAPVDATAVASPAASPAPAPASLGNTETPPPCSGIAARPDKGCGIACGGDSDSVAAATAAAAAAAAAAGSGNSSGADTALMLRGGASPSAGMAAALAASATSPASGALVIMQQRQQQQQHA